MRSIAILSKDIDLDEETPNNGARFSSCG